MLWFGRKYLVHVFAGLLERLRAGETVVCAEGYLFEFDRRGYLKAGAYVPEVVVDHPHLVKNMYEEFVHAGSDVVEAFTVSKNYHTVVSWHCGITTCMYT